MSYKIQRLAERPVSGAVTFSLVSDNPSISGTRGIYFVVTDDAIVVGTVEGTEQILKYQWGAAKGQIRRLLEAVLREGDV